jgi:tRNA (cytidine/uridine-2'-O-)-methyltransferase
MKIILFSPQIPQNTGNIARTCAATNTKLVLVRPLGFSVSDRQMKRAGLDYWDQVNLEVIDDLPGYLEKQGMPCFFFSSKAKKNYTQAQFPRNATLIFGSETEGLPQILWEQYPDSFYTIPMAPGPRCLNLASSAAVVLYEALRQTEFNFSPQS